MRKVREGLFFNASDLGEIKNKIEKYPWAKAAARKMEEEGEKLFKQEFYPLDYSWYKPYRNLTESITQDNYQNFNGKLYYASANSVCELDMQTGNFSEIYDMEERIGCIAVSKDEKIYFSSGTKIYALHR
jgi:hypothetical protein